MSSVPWGNETERADWYQHEYAEVYKELERYRTLEAEGRLIERDDSIPAIDELGRCTHRYCNKCDRYRRDLEAYKELAEQGKMIILPCKPDEWVWEAHPLYPTRQTTYCSNTHIVETLEAGYCIGYTKAEAEAKLAEMEKEHE